MSFSQKLTPQDIRMIDHSGMADHIAGMGNHIREAITLTNDALEHAQLLTGVRSIIVAGIGGSAIGGDLVKSYLTGTLHLPFIVNRGYELPPFADEGSLVIASSYSGNTEETLAMFEEAVHRKLRVICITTGGKLSARAKELGLITIAQRPGMQPRAALAYSFAPILLLLDRMHFTEGEEANLNAASTLLDTLTERYGTGHLSESNPAFALAGQLTHRIPAIYSANDYEAVNLRWRGQLQENAKHLAFGSLLPEMNHNEINGWAHPVDVLQHLFVILLRGASDEHPRVAKRLDVTKELLQGKQIPIVELIAEGNSRLERMFSLISLADWTS
ncbi:MAG TPA: bifunctional phosphoglucose/phosphomannose isomerase, partial [Candidatus Kapabacteria bacterium]|nr:bifunctional phosphoglucose/phosphomannose isomerase [Candidatus Kapabacteria bacterium]